ncbi:MAG: transcription repressor NadR [Lachnospiraceae bacterium]|nr:transcription repressor NadR [Lachnospiraceae bacterium]
MSGDERRDVITSILKESKEPVSGTMLAKKLGVSRQLIVQDIALIRARGNDIYSTYKGYVLEEKKPVCTRVFKVHHSDEDSLREMNIIVDLSGTLVDVFVYHNRYGVVKAGMNIKSRKDVILYLEDMKASKSSPLKNITSGYHYHTVTAETEKDLDMIQDALADAGFLAKLKEYEPVDFWSK